MKLNVLAIGNSYSQDAAYYLSSLAAADNHDLKIANLYIPACNLERHWMNIQSGARAYLYEENGRSAAHYISIEEALRMETWDYIVTQQSSYDSGFVETYFPYINDIYDYIAKATPQSELLLHETWAYEIDSLHPQFGNYHNNQQEMYNRLAHAYKSVSKQLGIRLIPSGDIIQTLRKKDPFVYECGGMSICRDGYHMTVLYGRYLLAATWYKVLTGNSLISNTYIPSTSLAPYMVCNKNILQIIKETVDTGVV